MTRAVESTAADTTLSRERFAEMLSSERATLRVIAAGEVGRGDAEDVVQEATISAMQRLGEFTPGTNFRAWMAAFVRNTARNHRRSERRRKARRLKATALAVAGSDRDPASEAAERMDGRLIDAVERLPPDQRICLLLKIVMGHSYDEIGAALDMQAATARSHVYRARKRLLGLLGGEGAADD